jgi:putative FmdB family regulatory protein
MPIYDFVCTNPDCQKEFEAIVQRYESPAPDCPDCGAKSERQEVKHRRYGPNSNDSSVRVRFNWPAL